MNIYLLAQQAEQQTTSTSWRLLWTLGFIVGALILPFVVGKMIANSLRMREYGWRIGLILCSVVVSCFIIGRTWDPEERRFNIPLGVDLQGGVILIYEVEDASKIIDDSQQDDSGAPQQEQRAQGRYSMSALIEALARRINPSGTKEIVVRPYGAGQVEIVIPEVDQTAVEQIKKVISTSGVLEFRIVANTRDHQDTVIAPARDMSLDPIRKRSRVVDDGGDPVGLWARVDREQNPRPDGTRPFRVDVSRDIIRNASSGEIITLPPDIFTTEQNDDQRRARLAQYIGEQGIQEIDILMATNDGLDVKGDHLGSVMKSKDEYMNPCILFDLTTEGTPLFLDLTSKNEPEGGFHRQLGIVLDNALLSAPNIQEAINQRGRITGQFTDEEVTFLVNILEAGSLPVVLNKEPISQSTISPLLGRETIEQGKVAMVGASALVFVFMLVYYRFSGVLACIALVINIVLTVAIMVLIKAPLTMPGLAGLVLTIGMSVDANVLIFERMREEIARGSALRMTIRNGFSRATATIIDANLTAILTAVILYTIGTDQLRGFAVVLILGILTSMFTAIFCARVAFDIVEKTRMLSSIKMFQFIGMTNWDFVGKRYIALTVSAIILVIGLVGVVVRGEDLFDIDFTGGSSVHVKLEQQADSEQVRAIVDPVFAANGIPYTLTGMSVAPGQTQSDTFKIDAKLPDVKKLEQSIQDAFQKAGGNLKLARHSLNIGPMKTVSAAALKAERDDTSAKLPTTGQPIVDPTQPALKSSRPGERPGTTQSQTPGATEKPADTEAIDTKEAENTGTESKDAPAASNDAASSPDSKASPASTPPKDETGEKPSGNEGAAFVLPDSSLVAFAFPQENAATDQATATENQQPASESPTPSEPPPASPANGQDQPAPSSEKTLETQEAAKSATEPSADKATDRPASPPANVDSKPASTGQDASKPKPTSTSQDMIEVDLEFGHEINEATLRGQIEETAKALNIPLSYFDLSNPNWQGGSNAYSKWTLRIPATRQETETLLNQLQDRFSNTPVWSSSNKIGPQVAGKMQRTAIAALVASWIGIIIYVWIRFQNLVFGLAAVIALIHDVLVTVAALALSRWLTGPLGFLLVEDFKISLTIIAALLTIIGYSINDTIVIFDRLREVRGKSPDLTAEMVNLSLNQTLSRTLLTAFTVFLVVIVLYAFGGQGIHGFAFAMLIGVISGTYSTVYIATPFVLWLAGKSIVDRPKSAAA